LPPAVVAQLVRRTTLPALLRLRHPLPPL